uniref:Flagellin n=1 Tax=Ignisphaera aggregans TaxID=334771 RepID=A0A7C2ZNK9_9CREN
MRTWSRARRGIVGIEAAIVLIAFVALNMGFYTTQRSKEVMSAGLSQASSSLEVDGSVLAVVDNQKKLECMVIPIRLSAGQKEVDLTPSKTAIALWVIDKAAFTNIYKNNSQAIPDLTESSAFSSDTDAQKYNITALCNGVGTNRDIGGVAVIWGPGSNGDNVLGPGEKVLVVINFTAVGIDSGLESYDVVKVEIKPPLGAALTIERTVPASLSAKIIDLG